MKIGLFLEKFSDVELEKDPGLIAFSLLQEGAEIKIFSHSFSGSLSQKLLVNQVGRSERQQISYWRNSSIEVLIIYSWLSWRYGKMIRAAKKAGLKVILKLDSDGTLLYPLKPSYLKVFGLNKSLGAKIKHLLRLIQWKFLAIPLSKNRIKQLCLADGAIIETPSAKESLVYSLKYWKRENLSKKIAVIPNPINYPLPTLKNKKKVITSIGRWQDTRKNAPGLEQVLGTLKTTWQINLIGPGALSLKNKVKKNNPQLLLQAIENLSHLEIFECLAETKVFFAPSLAESFNLAAAEALCSGCSIVGGPLPSFQYFSQNNQFGTLAKDFKASSLKFALETDLKKWADNLYQPEQIATSWQKELSPEKVGQQIIELIKNL